MRKSWREKLDGARAPHVTVLEKRYAGIPAGARLLVSSPRQVSEFIEKIPAGTTRSVYDMRRALAAAAEADATCPTSSGIFLRIVSEAALEELKAGAAPERVPPFWRLVDPESAMATRLSCGADYVRKMRKSEAVG